MLNEIGKECKYVLGYSVNNVSFAILFVERLMFI